MGLSVMRQRSFWWLVATVVASTHALAQAGVVVPVGRNLRARPDEAGDVVLEINRAGTYALNGRLVTAAQLANQLAMLMSHTRDHVIYVRADASLPSSAIDSAATIAVRGEVCVASLIGMQRAGTMSTVAGDWSRVENVRRAIDVQLPLPGASEEMITRQQARAIVLEVLQGPTYRINTQAVSADSLTSRLRAIFDPRPDKVLLVRADPAMSYQDVFHAMDVARGANGLEIVAAPPGLAIRPTLPDIDLTRSVTIRDDSIAARIPGNIGRCRRGDAYFGPRVPMAADPDHVYFEFQVEKLASVVFGAAPEYPDVLRAAGVNGRVLGQFVVDTNGRALPETFKVLSSTHDLFTQSVKAALPDIRFAPATIGGKPVRQLVQMSFDFKIPH
jgi:TonB family protein